LYCPARSIGDRHNYVSTDKNGLRRHAVADLALVLLTVGLFALLALVVKAVERL
jgi:hypothetical protein